MNKIKKLFNIIQKMFSIMDKKQKKELFFVFIMMVFASLLETLSISSFLPFVYSIINPEEFLMNQTVIRFLTFFNIQISNFLQLITIIGVGLVSIFLFRSLFLMLTNYLQLNFQNRMLKHTSVMLFSQYLKRPFTDMININSSEATKIISTNSTSVYYVLQSFCFIILNFIKFLFIFAFLISLDTKLVIEASLFILIIGIVLIFCFNTVISKSGVLFNNAMAQVSKYSYEALTGLREITVSKVNEFFIQRYEKAAENKKRSELVFRFLQLLPNIILEAIFFMVLIILVLINVRSGLSIIDKLPSFMVIAYGTIRLLPCVSTIISNFESIVYYYASFNEACENLHKSEDYLLDTDNTFEDITKNDFSCIKVNNLYWKYDSKKENVLNNVSLSINKGDCIGLIGKSGSGKSTFADILLGVFKPNQSNVITVDDIDVFDIPKTWAKLVGYVPQRVFLLDDTILNNILYGRTIEANTEEKVWKALEIAHLTDFVMSLPEQLNTVVGEFGVKFSGGQRQRLSIARALYDNPKFLVFDEATSALDNETEKSFMDSINSFQGKITMLIITHRLSTIKNCTRVYEIEKGILKEVRQ